MIFNLAILICVVSLILFGLVALGVIGFGSRCRQQPLTSIQAPVNSGRSINWRRVRHVWVPNIIFGLAALIILHTLISAWNTYTPREVGFAAWIWRILSVGFSATLLIGVKMILDSPKDLIQPVLMVSFFGIIIWWLSGGVFRSPEPTAPKVLPSQPVAQEERAAERYHLLQRLVHGARYELIIDQGKQYTWYMKLSNITGFVFETESKNADRTLTLIADAEGTPQRLEGTYMHDNGKSPQLRTGQWNLIFHQDSKSWKGKIADNPIQLKRLK